MLLATGEFCLLLTIRHIRVSLSTTVDFLFPLQWRVSVRYSRVSLSATVRCLCPLQCSAAVLSSPACYVCVSGWCLTVPLTQPPWRSLMSVSTAPPHPLSLTRRTVLYVCLQRAVSRRTGSLAARAHGTRYLCVHSVGAPAWVQASGPAKPRQKRMLLFSPFGVSHLVLFLDSDVTHIVHFFIAVSAAFSS